MNKELMEALDILEKEKAEALGDVGRAAFPKEGRHRGGHWG